ncbi:hypothetical protein HTG_04155 [Natrinema mahii]|nr:hypothetical protein HTG_04155 [Natrinema mahii]
MSKEPDIERRKVLMSTGTLGSAVMAMSTGAAAESEDESDQDELTEAEVKRALAEMEVRPTTTPTNGSSVRPATADSPSGDVMDDAEIYVGKHKNAETPAGKPYEIESYDEYLDREAPPGFPATYYQGSSLTTDTISTAASVPSFYLKENIGSVSLAGYTFNVGVGVGVKISTTGVGGSAELSLDLYIGGVSIAISNFSVGYGVSGKQFCLSNIKASYSVLDLDVDVCGTASYSGSDFSIGGSVSICADPCKVISCEACKKVRFDLSEAL